MCGTTGADKAMVGQAMVGAALADAAAAGLQANAAGTTTADSPTPDEQHARRLLALFELSRIAMTSCTHCKGTSLIRWGFNRRGLQRWQCGDCGRAFTAATGTALARVHSLDKLREVAADMLTHTPRSCRELAASLGLDRMTIWRWRRLIGAVWARLQPLPTTAAGGADAVVLRESRKASREWVDHHRAPHCHPAPDRLRWIDYRQLDLPLPEPMDRYRVPVQLAAASCCRATPQPFETSGQFHHPLFARVPPAPAPEKTAALHGCPNDTRGPADSADPTMRVNDVTPHVPLSQRFRHFLAPFRGPATRHLDTYTAWFTARLGTTARVQRATVC
jgi:transposase-like protein